MNPFIKYLNWIVLAFNVVICILTITGYLTFGFGLGDIAYLFGITVIVIFNLIFTVQIIKKRISNAKIYLFSTVFLILALYYLYSLTIGQGSE